jgi:Sulfotransferase family
MNEAEVISDLDRAKAATRDAPFFIVGAGRSGTTLLRLVLAGHSRLHIPPETWFIEDLVRKFSLTEPLTHAEVQDAVTAMAAGHRWPDMGIDIEDMRHWARQLDKPKLADVLNLLYRKHLTRVGKPRFGDKTPCYIAILPELAKLYPGAKFIHLIRDGRDVAISIIDAKWTGRCYDGRNFDWTRAIRLGFAYRSSPLAAQIMELKYEDLVSSFEPTIRRICAFLGEEFEPSMLEFSNRIELVPEREQHIHQKLQRPVSADAVEVWRQKLSGLECFVLEACLHRYLTSLHYPLRFYGLGWRPLFTVSSLLLRISAPVLNRAIPYLKRRNYLSKNTYL